MCCQNAIFLSATPRWGRPQGFTFNVADLNVRAGARFIVAVCGKILLMPGSERPAANSMTIDDNKILMDYSDKRAP